VSQSVDPCQGLLNIPTYTVSRFGRGDYLSLADAVDECEPGSRIYIEDGIYSETIVIRKSVEIIGLEGSTKPIIDFLTTLRIENADAYISMKSIVLKGVADESKEQESLLEVTGGEFTLDNCEIIGADHVNIKVVGPKSKLRVKNSRIQNPGGGGIVFMSAAYGQISKCELGEFHGFAIHLDTSSNVSLHEIKIEKIKGCAIRIANGSKLSLSDAYIQTCWGGSLCADMDTDIEVTTSNIDGDWVELSARPFSEEIVSYLVTEDNRNALKVISELKGGHFAIGLENTESRERIHSGYLRNLDEFIRFVYSIVSWYRGTKFRLLSIKSLADKQKSIEALMNSTEDDGIYESLGAWRPNYEYPNTSNRRYASLDPLDEYF